MARNVRCVGQGFPGAWPYVNMRLAKTGKGKPCGWKGQRSQIETRDTASPTGWRRPDVTAKPCPTCGGRVEQIPGVLA
jgi:hypothetical protein